MNNYNGFWTESDLDKIAPKVKPKRHTKRPMQRRSFRQRIQYLVDKPDNSISWKLIYKLIQSYVHGRKGIEDINFKRHNSINFDNMIKAVDAMKKFKSLSKSDQKSSNLSINKIAKKYHVSKISMYRYYNKSMKIDKNY